MGFLLVSFLAGVLTVLAPCTLPLLPVIVGGSLTGKNKRNPYIIAAALACSIVVFTLILKASTAFIMIPEYVWSSISGGIIIIFGIITLFPRLWDVVSFRLGLGSRSEHLLASAGTESGLTGDILIGLALGPVFSSCSPTYFVILATVLPASFERGVFYLAAYAAGLAGALLLISLLGQRLVKNIRFAANPSGWFKRTLGVLFLIVGILVITHSDRRLQTYLLDRGWYSSGTTLEQKLIEAFTTSTTSLVPNDTEDFPRFREIVNPSGFVNTSSITIGELIGKKVILLDFMTYSCINCIRTFPYLNEWYEKYRASGLEIIGIHTPEFAFEKNIDNVKKALNGFGIKFPVVLDNDYATWNTYGNNYWPRKYLIDLDGRIVYDHIGEGHYAETEAAIRRVLPMNVSTTMGSAVEPARYRTSPEIYFGAWRNEHLGNGTRGAVGAQTFVEPRTPDLNELILSGHWLIEREYAQNSAKGFIAFSFQAKNVFFVASSPTKLRVRVLRDNKPLTTALAGEDIVFENGMSYVYIQADRLYRLIKNDNETSSHLLKLEIDRPGLKAYTFTFG